MTYEETVKALRQDIEEWEENEGRFMTKYEIKSLAEWLTDWNWVKGPPRVKE